MGRKYAQINIEKRLKEGFGQGSGKDYKEWLSVQSFSSLGYAHRVPGWKTGREHHVFSNLERDVVLILDWSSRVVDRSEALKYARSTAFSLNLRMFDCVELPDEMH